LAQAINTSVPFHEKKIANKQIRCNINLFFFSFSSTTPLSVFFFFAYFLFPHNFTQIETFIKERREDDSRLTHTFGLVYLIAVRRKVIYFENISTAADAAEALEECITHYNYFFPSNNFAFTKV